MKLVPTMEKKPSQLHTVISPRSANCGTCKERISSFQKRVDCSHCHRAFHKRCSSSSHECIAPPVLKRKKSRLGKSAPDVLEYPPEKDGKGHHRSMVRTLSNSATDVFKSAGMLVKKSTQTHSPAPVPAPPSSEAGWKHPSCPKPKNLREKKILTELQCLDNVGLVPLQKTPSLSDGQAFFQPLLERDYWTEADASLVIRHLLEALSYLHENHVVHGVLRPEFVFLKSDLSVRLANYGLWRTADHMPSKRHDLFSRMYLPPEVLENRSFGRSSDMWTVGVIAYILLCGRPPFYGSDEKIVTESVVQADFDYPEEDGWDDVSDNAIDFIDSLLLARESHRMTVQRALQHPFITEPCCTVLHSVIENLDSTMSLYQMNLDQLGAM